MRNDDDHPDLRSDHAEAAGILDIVLDRVALQIEKEQQIKREQADGTAAVDVVSSSNHPLTAISPM
jgi:hypothetical protein